MNEQDINTFFSVPRLQDKRRHGFCLYNVGIKKIKRLYHPILMMFWFVIFSSGTGLAAQVHLAWDANSESDLLGYKIYYKTGSSGAPYDGSGADQGPSGISLPLEEIEDVDNSTFT